MSHGGFYVPSETLGVVETTGITKAAKRIDKLVILSFLAGVYIAFGFMAAISAGGRFADPGLRRLVYAGVFPVGLMFVIIAGGELFTGNTMFLIPGLLKRKISVFDLLRVWAISFVVNCAAIILVAVVYASILDIPLVADFARSLLNTKLALNFWQLFVRGIAANWLVNLAILLAYAANSIGGKLLGIWFSIFAFVIIGFEHSIANVFLYMVVIVIGGTEVTFWWLLWDLIPVVLGNIIGGAGFVGVLYSYIHNVERSGRLVFPPPTPMITGERKTPIKKAGPSPLLPPGDTADVTLGTGREASEPLLTRRSQSTPPSAGGLSARPPRPNRKEALPQ
ncbi:hypothetical protein RCL1_000426 [Eukaryota sp. TZLM3-RCL]